MLDPILAALPAWRTFYVITGSAAAALTGLMFVVIALSSRATIDALVLLFAGIRNAWDAAVYIATKVG